MSELGNEVVYNARGRIGEPFRHHFKPIDLCEGGTWTVDTCMERGMDMQGYDCSGLAIASLCAVLGVSTSEWPRELRHAHQLATLATQESFTPGDLRLYYSTNSGIHIGIATATQDVIHSSGLTHVVEENIVPDRTDAFEAVRVISIESLYRAAILNR